MTPSAPPALAGRLDGLAGSVFSQLAAMLSAHEGETYPLHVGDTWKAPPPGCRLDDLDPGALNGLNRYTKVPGWDPLREALRERIARRTGVPVAADGVLVGAGATACLHAAAGALVTPGAEVLVLAPAWPLFAGMVRAWGGRPIHVPWFGAVDGPEAAAEQLDRYATDATVAVYLNTPNNPTGLRIPPAVLQAIAAWARRRGVWIVSDEIYEELGYRGEHAWIRAYAPERTVAARSFSKAYGMAGYRVGALVGPPDLIRGATTLALYGWYCAPHPLQVLAKNALSDAGDTWLDETRAAYDAINRDVAARLGVAPADGSTFLFLDVADVLDGRPLEALLRELVGQGLLVAPGPSFGPYPTHIRVCFTSVAPDVTRRGVEVLAAALGRGA